MTIFPYLNPFRRRKYRIVERADGKYLAQVRTRWGWQSLAKAGGYWKQDCNIVDCCLCETVEEARERLNNFLAVIDADELAKRNAKIVRIVE